MAEARSNACPAHIIAAGASAADCECAASELFKLGHDGVALSQQEVLAHEATKGGRSGRAVAIGLLRLEAFATCGFFEADHPVNRGLGAASGLQVE